jgi:hypothetical protein
MGGTGGAVPVTALDSSDVKPGPRRLPPLPEALDSMLWLRLRLRLRLRLASRARASTGAAAKRIALKH